MSDDKAKKLRPGDRVRAVEEIRMDDWPMVDINPGDEGTVLRVEMPEKLRSLWRVDIRFDGKNYVVQIRYPTTRVERLKKFLSIA